MTNRPEGLGSRIETQIRPDATFNPQPRRSSLLSAHSTSRPPRIGSNWCDRTPQPTLLLPHSNTAAWDRPPPRFGASSAHHRRRAGCAPSAIELASPAKYSTNRWRRHSSPPPSRMEEGGAGSGTINGGGRGSLSREDDDGRPSAPE